MDLFVARVGCTGGGHDVFFRGWGWLAAWRGPVIRAREYNRGSVRVDLTAHAARVCVRVLILSCARV